MRLACLLPVMALGACATTTPPAASAPPAAEPEATCRNDALGGFAGRVRSEALGRQLLGASKAKILRWVTPGMMVTMDYRTDRLTVHLDAANRIERARCG